MADDYRTATFAGGCFWCMQPPFDETEGVVATRVGYTGGDVKNPSYEEVSAGGTGHAEAIEVVYDPEKISYERLLEIFWKNIDPTVKDRQFCDVGSQYRSAIFYRSEEEKKMAEKSRDALPFGTVHTEIVPAAPFYLAEEYHQDYYRKNPYRYKVYRYLCGRDKRLEELWNRD